MKASRNTLRWVPLPPDFASTVIDCTIDEAASFRRCSRWTIFQKIREGDLVAFKDGRVTKITVASLVRDRDRSLAAARMPSLTAHRPLDAAQPVVAETKPVLTKRPVGRPRKPRAEEHPALEARSWPAVERSKATRAAADLSARNPHEIANASRLGRAPQRLRRG